MTDFKAVINRLFYLNKGVSHGTIRIISPRRISNVSVVTLLDYSYRYLGRTGAYLSCGSIQYERLREEVPVLAAANNQKGLEALCAEDGGVAAEMLTSAIYRDTVKSKNAALQGAAGAIAGRLRARLSYLELSLLWPRSSVCSVP